MNDFFGGVGVIFSIEMRQRVRGVAWYVLLGIFVLLVAVVTFLVWVINSGLSAQGQTDAGASIFSTIVYFVLLLGSLVAPALSGNAINGDREGGTLATSQVTLVTTWQLVIGKFFAAWVSALAFLVASVPFILVAAALGGLNIDTLLVAIPLLAIELGVFCALGVGLSGLLDRPLFSVVVTYLAVAGLTIGSLIVFGLGGLAVQSMGTYTYSYAQNFDQNTGVGTDCVTEVSERPVPRFDYFWGALVANPFVVLADAVPTHFDAVGQPDDLFGQIKFGVRSVQLTPNLDEGYDDCAPRGSNEPPSAREVIGSTVPGWFVGLAIHLVLSAAALFGAFRRLHTPAVRLGKGSRIA